MSYEFGKICKMFGIQKVSTSAYHSQSNGALERAHRKLAPNDILYGYISQMPIKEKVNPDIQYNFDSEYSNIYHSLQKVWAWAKENQEKAKELSKEYYMIFR